VSVAESQESPRSFEQKLAELESIVKSLEEGDLPLEQALELFERGVALSEQCRKQLEEAETRVEILLRKNNKIEPEPFNPEDFSNRSSG